MKVNSYRQSKLSTAVISALAIGAISAPVSPAAGKPGYSRTPNAIIGTGADAIIGTGADAIIGTGADAIIGTGADAIIGTGADAIIGTGANAIIGTGADAIIGTGANAIIGTGADAIIGTGADAIIGTGANAIIGTGADAIIGTGANAIIGTGIDATLSTGSETVGTKSISGKIEVALMGPVTSFSAAEGTVALLGRNFQLPKSSAIFGRIADAAKTGEIVQIAVYGQLSGNGDLKRTSAAIIADQYVPGVSNVVASGRITAVDSATAKFAVGNLEVDYSQTLAKGPMSLKVGDVVRVNGVQYQNGDALYASALIRVNR